MWLDKITGRDNIYHLSLDWLRFLNNGLYERVAQSNIVVSCVKVIGHGKAVIAKPPDFLQRFFNNMKPTSIKKKSLDRHKILFENINFGKKIKDCKKNPALVFRSFYQTSLEHSNLIGNIYFSNYSKWVNSTKDLFLYQNKPGLFSRGTSKGEFITLECSVSHLQEAMPFDKIFVKMYLDELCENGVVLKYEVFKGQRNSPSIKLAIVSQTIVFVEYNKSTPNIRRIPREILDSLLRK